MRDGVATITLDSPSNRNALSLQLTEELLARLVAVREDDAARVVVLTHTGSAFCAGADLKARGQQVPLVQVLGAVWELPKPVVARVGGHVRAGGVGLVAACDLSVAASDATFAFTEVRLGLVPAVISVSRASSSSCFAVVRCSSASSWSLRSWPALVAESRSTVCRRL